MGAFFPLLPPVVRVCVCEFVLRHELHSEHIFKKNITYIQAKARPVAAAKVML